MEDRLLFSRRRYIKRIYDSTENPPPLLPKLLYCAMKCFGLDISLHLAGSEKLNSFQNILSSKTLKIVVSHVPVFLRFMEWIIYFKHMTFFIADVIDHYCYLVAFGIFLYRKRQIVFCISSMLKIPQSKKPKKQEVTSVFIGIALIYACVYMSCGIYIGFEGKDAMATTFHVINWILFCIFVTIGMSLQMILFVRISSLAHDGLFGIAERLEGMLKRDVITAQQIYKERVVFCRLQKFISKADSTFNEVMFLWFTRITVRCCLGIIDMLTRSWTDEEGSTQIIVILDFIADIYHLLVLSYFAGKMVHGKSDVKESLIYLCGNCVCENDDARCEIKLLAQLLESSDINFTAAKTFPVTRGTAVTIFGALASYAVLIYQLGTTPS